MKKGTPILERAIHGALGPDAEAINLAMEPSSSLRTRAGRPSH
jgi:hypothetical protein